MLKRVAISGLLAYALFITVTCPCRELLSCHRVYFTASLAGAYFLSLVNFQQ